MRLLITGDFFVSNPNKIRIDKNIRDLFISCDYRIVNCEAPIINSNETDISFIKSGPRLMQPIDSIGLLKEIKVDALTLSNNHIMDQGIQGYYKTVNLLKSFMLLGAGNWDEAYAVKKIIIGGIKVGLINLSEMQFGMLSDEWIQDKNAIGCAWVNHNRVNKLIIEEKKDVDYLVAIVHAGLEMLEVPLPEWRDRYREMVDLGCDAVIAHHPHVVQGYEIYKGKPIVYSLGNFCFTNIEGQDESKWNTGAIAILNIGYNNLELELHGCHLHSGVLSKIDENKWDKNLKRLCNSLISPEYQNIVNTSSLSFMKNYWELFAMGGLFNPKCLTIKDIGRLLLCRYNYVHAINNIQCESHRWCVLRALKSIIYNSNNNKYE